MVVQVLIAILGISLLVIVHEAGHYFAARAFGMRVTRFSVGFGPVLASYQPKGSPTTFQICAIPFLAYVMIAGMNPAEEVDPQDDSLYPNKGVFARIITIFAGPFANYAAASVMVFVLALTVGWFPSDPSKAREPMEIAAVEPESPAAKAGLAVGDLIVEAQGRSIRNVGELIEVTAPRAGQETVYVVERAGKRLAPLRITPRDNEGRGVIGVIPVTRVQMNLSEAAIASMRAPFDLTLTQLKGMGEMIRRRTTEGLTGPVGIVKLGAQQAEKGVFPFVFMLIAMSVALGLFNLLPFPALDGGRLVFLGYEVITRRRPNERFEATVHALGLLFLLGVIALVTYRDVVG